MKTVNLEYVWVEIDNCKVNCILTLHLDNYYQTYDLLF